MPTESELRTFLQEVGPADGQPRTSLDTGVILRRVRRRRLPKQIALGGTVTLAAAGLGVASIQGLRLAGTSGSTSAIGSASDSAPESALGEESGTGPEAVGGGDPASGGESIRRAPASKLNLCGGNLAEVSPSVTGLVVVTDFADGAPADGSPVSGTVTMTNTGTERISGTTDATPAITLSQNGLVLWHSNGPMDAMLMIVDLAPGESLQYGASFTPVRCGIEDDSAEAFRENLPALEAGTYDVSAAIDIMLDKPVSDYPDIELVTGPLAPISIG